jgi:predicted NBD/HSP70 family sugar kinase
LYFGVLKSAYEKNHQDVKDELDKVVDLIAITTANINLLLGLDIIILGGRMAALGEYYLISIKKMIGELCPFTPYIMNSTLKDNSVIYGMLAIGQEHIINDLLQ